MTGLISVHFSDAAMNRASATMFRENVRQLILGVSAGILLRLAMCGRFDPGTAVILRCRQSRPPVARASPLDGGTGAAGGQQLRGIVADHRFSHRSNAFAIGSKLLLVLKP